MRILSLSDEKGSVAITIEERDISETTDWKALMLLMLKNHKERYG